jgi:hypothetical protein
MPAEEHSERSNYTEQKPEILMATILSKMAAKLTELAQEY